MNRFLKIVGVGCLCTSTMAQTTERLSDLGSPQQRVEATVEWKQSVGSEGLTRSELNAMLARMDNVEIRLDTTHFEGREARIFLALPAQIRGLQSPQDLRMSWTTEGLFESGSVIPGSRALIFDGIVPASTMVDRFDFVVEINASAVDYGLDFDPIYEIETND